jgi:hypothetical protein
MPDFLKGEVADYSWVPPDTDEKMKAFSAFIDGPASISEAAGAISGVLEDVREKSGSRIAKWGALGFCWGYKVCSCLDFGRRSGRGREHLLILLLFLAHCFTSLRFVARYTERLP